MSSLERMAGIARPKIRKLARQGRLVDETFKVFQRSCYPNASPDQVATMRTCFFAGASEIATLMMFGLDEGTAETDGDLEFMSQWQDEIERFHRRTIDTMTAKGTPHAQ